MTGNGLHIFPQHAELLKASAISCEVADARGYVSVDAKARLEPCGFTKSQRIVPGLLIPLHGADGTVRLHQYRPDNARLDAKGKPRKYETPYRSTLCLDVPPGALAAIADPDVRLWITEGSRKADAAVTAGLCCIALIGVDGWQSKGVALPDWKDVRLKDREVLIAYDSDVMTKDGVAGALARITTYLVYRGAKVRHVTLPQGEGGAKVGLDDYLAAGHSVDELHSLARDPARTHAISGKLPEQPPPGQVDDSNDPLPDEPRTELGYARRLVHVYGDRLRYVPAWRRWLVWDGTRWAHDTTGQAHRWAKVIARGITTGVMAAGGDKDAVSAARRGESSHAVAGALTLAGTEEGIVATPDDLDADPFLLNCTNGTLDLRTSELRPHDPADLVTKMTGAAYRPDAAGLGFTKFLDRVQPDPAMRDYLARLLGHALEGRVVTHILPIFHGEGGNGKGTLVNVVLSALGDYADAADPELLTAKTFDAHPTGTADLFGLRLAVLHESDHGRRLAEGTVKRLTGGDRIKARRMREDFWHFEPSHTFLMLTNHKPVVGGTDEGIWRRLRLVPWDVIIPKDERDEHLGDQLALELDAVLAWLTAGYQDWRNNGLGDPAAVVEATASYRDESDALKRFIGQRCLTGPHYHVGSSELFSAWCRWCDAEGEEHGTQTAFARAVQDRGLDKFKDGSGRMRWKGIGLAGDGGEGGEP